MNSSSDDEEDAPMGGKRPDASGKKAAARPAKTSTTDRVSVKQVRANSRKITPTKPKPREQSAHHKPVRVSASSRHSSNHSHAPHLPRHFGFFHLPTNHKSHFLAHHVFHPHNTLREKIDALHALLDRCREAIENETPPPIGDLAVGFGAVVAMLESVRM
jgi:hypothetical protein